MFLADAGRQAGRFDVHEVISSMAQTRVLPRNCHDPPGRNSRAAVGSRETLGVPGTSHAGEWTRTAAVLKRIGLESTRTPADVERVCDGYS